MSMGKDYAEESANGIADQDLSLFFLILQLIINAQGEFISRKGQKLEFITWFKQRCRKHGLSEDVLKEVESLTGCLYDDYVH